MYWDLQGIEERFNYRNFAYLPQYLVHQALKARNSQMNLDQMTQARLILLQIQMNTPSDKQSQLPSLVDFLPFPQTYIQETQDLKIKLTRKTAIKILKDYPDLPPSMKFALEPILDSIEKCSQLY